jgi:hypothetical protein
LGRRVLGEKWVDRFAANKLARHLEILSRCPARSDEIRVVIDWDHFDDDSLMLDEVLSQWEVRPAQELKRHGIVLRLTGLRSIWSKRMFRRPSLCLSRLLSPFRDGVGFTIRIESDEFPQYRKLAPACFVLSRVVPIAGPGSASGSSGASSRPAGLLPSRLGV